MRCPSGAALRVAGRILARICAGTSSRPTPCSVQPPRDTFDGSDNHEPTSATLPPAIAANLRKPNRITDYWCVILTILISVVADELAVVGLGEHSAGISSAFAVRENGAASALRCP